MIRLTLCLASAFTLPVYAAAPEPLVFAHYDWELACDNTGTCRAAGYHDEEAETAAALSVLLTRAAGPQAPVTGQLMLGHYGEDPFAAGEEQAVTLWIDGTPLGRVTLADFSGQLPRDYVDAMLPVLAGDGTIAFLADDGRRWALSTRGATAVLLKMDDAQGRVGTRGALVKPGTRDETAVPPPAPPPVVRIPPLTVRDGEDLQYVDDSEKLRDALDAALGEDDECFDLLDPDAPYTPLEVVRLSETKLLVSHRCWLAAYNAGRGYWVIDDEPPWNPVVVTTLGTDYADGTITASHKSRGLGDCWSEDAWSWDGTRFVPTASSSTGMCRFVAPGGAWSLPTRVVEVERAGR